MTSVFPSFNIPNTNTNTKISFTNFHKISNTLQGEVFRCKNTKSKETVIIKKTSIQLHQHSLSNYIHGKQHKILENIIQEASIMKLLTAKASGLNIARPMVKFRNLFQNETDYFLEIEDGGTAILALIREAHQLILLQRLKLMHWRNTVKYIMWNLSTFLYWLHSVSCCHLDISLSNILIKNAYWVPDTKHPGCVKLCDNFEVKVCDFGLAEIFADDRFACSKQCGKANYMAPEMVSDGHFHANKADVWSLGVAFYAMAVGLMPYNLPDVKKDCCYACLAVNKLYCVLMKVRRCNYVSLEMLNLMQCMLNFNESARFDMAHILQHEWFANYHAS